MASNFLVSPGGVIGIIGGGQLGRMTAIAAARLGYKCHIFTPEENSPASQIAFATTIAEYDDLKALEAFAKQVDVVTFEFENIPSAVLEFLESLVPVRPNRKALEIAQNRLKEKRFFNDLGIDTAPWREVNSLSDLEAALKEIGYPAVIKTTTLGYDGKGQAKISCAADILGAWEIIKGREAVLEGFVDFHSEISVIIAQSADGAWAAYDVVENIHKNHILDLTIAPANIEPALAQLAVKLVHRAVEALGLIGVLAVELFVTKNHRLLVNEMAPRPHNSGHWTIDATASSQFEQLVRAVCGLPLGSPYRTSNAVMKNLIGDDVNNWQEALKDPAAKLHLYGKAEVRPGRKMGHITRLITKPAK